MLVQYSQFPQFLYFFIKYNIQFRIIKSLPILFPGSNPRFVGISLRCLAKYASTKKTRTNSETSHQSNENFALRTQFPVVLSIVDKTQNFMTKRWNFQSYGWLMQFQHISRRPPFSGTGR